MLTQERPTTDGTAASTNRPRRWAWIAVAVVCAVLSAVAFAHAGDVAGAWLWSIRLAVAATIMFVLAVCPGLGVGLGIYHTVRALLHAPKLERPSSGADESNHWALIALCRFVLAAAVLVCHIFIYTINGDHGSRWHYLNLIGGFPAVIAFLMISGYSIAASLERSSAGYFRRRFWRIMPVFWVCCILTAIPWLIAGPTIRLANGITFNAPDWSQIASNVLLIPQTFLSKELDGMASWTLAIEATFYVAAFWLIRLNRVVALLIAASGCFFATHCPSHVGWYLETHGVAVAGLGWAWLGGFLMRTQRGKWITPAIIIPVCAYLLSYNCSSVFPLAIPAVVAVGCLLYARPWIPAIPSRARAAMNSLGDLSYPLYMCHPAILLVCRAEDVVSAPIILIVVVICSSTILCFVDRPLRHGLRAKTTRSTYVPKCSAA